MRKVFIIWMKTAELLTPLRCTPIKFVLVVNPFCHRLYLQFFSMRLMLPLWRVNSWGGNIEQMFFDKKEFEPIDDFVLLKSVRPLQKALVVGLSVSVGADGCLYADQRFRAFIWICHFHGYVSAVWCSMDGNTCISSGTPFNIISMVVYQIHSLVHTMGKLSDST